MASEDLATSRKQVLREDVWAALERPYARRGGDISDEPPARFPGARGRIPNFRGAEAAAEALADLGAFRRARVLKCNPDSPQRRVRHLALKAGKTVLMAVPKLADACPFLALDPEALGDRALWKASSIKGASALGRPVRLGEVPDIDLIVTGCVAAGRGRDVIPRERHDVTLDWIVTPQETIRCKGRPPRPRGIRWELLSEERIAAIPVLSDRRTETALADGREGE